MQMIMPDWWEEWVIISESGRAVLKKNAPHDVRDEFEKYFKEIEDSHKVK